MKGTFQDMTLPKEKLYGIYRGVVEDNSTDTLFAGRCKVRVFGVHSPNIVKTDTDGIPTDELPWAEPVLGLIEGSISGYGLFSVPLQGSHVFVFFEGGNILQPRYFGSSPGVPIKLPDITKGFNDPDGEYPTLERLFQPDWNNGGDSSTRYPHNIFLKTHGEHEIEVDSTPGNKRFRLFHPSGTEIKIDDDGNVDISIVSNESRNITINRSTTVGGNDITTVTGNELNTINGNLIDTIKGNEVKTVSGTSNESVTGTKDVNVTGVLSINVTGACTITSGGIITLDAPSVKLGAGPARKLMVGDASAAYNSHTHGTGANSTYNTHTHTVTVDDITHSGTTAAPTQQESGTTSSGPTPTMTADVQTTTTEAA